MGKDSELIKAAKSGNNAYLEKTFAALLKKGGGHSFGSGLGSIRHKSANPNIQDEQGYTLLHHATLHGQKDTVSLLLRCGASTTIPDCSGSCPLHLAAWKGDLDIVQLLVVQGPSRPNINQLSDSEDSALHLASQYGYSKVVEFLLQRHADPLVLNVKGETPLDLAALYGHLDTVHLLISHCPEILHLSRPQFSPLHLAARNGHSLVALSLINAGISVNTVCERGTALHEAAMCGKVETVELLLDKGVNVELKSTEGQTVLEMLQGFSADKAREIHRLIQEHTAKGSSPPRTDKPRIIAVAQKESAPLAQSSAALPFSEGDSIVVQRRTGRDLFVGQVHGRSGSFLADDVTFFRERDGQLVPMDASRLSPSLSAAGPGEGEGQGGGGHQEEEIPFSDLPGFPVGVGSPDSDVSIQSGSGSEGGVAGPVSQVPRPERGSRGRLSKKEKKFQLAKDDGRYTELRPIDPQVARKEYGESLRLNPVGPAFASLDSPPEGETPSKASNLVSPSGDPEQGFAGSYYVLEIGNFPQPAGGSENVERTEEKEEEKGDVIASPAAYYMLEVKNCEGVEGRGGGGGGEGGGAGGGGRVEEPAGPAPARSASALSYENIDVTGAAKSTLPEAFYDTPRNVAHYLQSKGAGQGAGPAKTAPSPYMNVNLAKQTSAPIEVPGPRAGGGAGPAIVYPHPSSASYENVALFQGHTPPPVYSRSLDDLATPLRPASPYENTPRRPPPPSLDVSVPSLRVVPSPHDTPPPRPPPPPLDSPPEDAPTKRRSRRREEVYQSVSLGSKVTTAIPPVMTKKGAESRISEASSQSGEVRENGEGGIAGGERGVRKRAEGEKTKGVSKEGAEKEEKEEAVKQEGAKEAVKQEGAKEEVKQEGAKEEGVKMEGAKDESAKKEEEITEGEERRGGAKASAAPGVAGADESDEAFSIPRCDSVIIANSAENPFVGLVISASSQLEEGGTAGQSDPPSNGRIRTETIWDNDRVELEWSSIDTVLSDVRGTFPTSPTYYRTSPPTVAVETKAAPSNQQPESRMFEWLSEIGLSGYASALESNGFDDLWFLSGDILAKDDLDDIGISSEEDQLTLMAAVQLLPPPPLVRHASLLTDWLEALNLTSLGSKFDGYSLRKISQLWSVELSSVVGIELLGQRKRLQYGISELRAAHPNWQTRLPSSPSSSPSRSPRSSAIDNVSLLRDYRNIRSTASPKSSPRSSRAEQTTSIETAQSDSRPGSRPVSSDVSVRSPQEAQASVGVHRDRRCSLPSDSWRHPNTALIQETVSYHVKYLGSVEVLRVKGTQSTEEACLRLRTSTRNMRKVPEIILNISWKGVKFFDAHTKNIVSTHAVRDISYCSQDIEDKSVFAYISKDRAGANYCHVFMAPSREVSDEIIMTIGQAFEIAYQKVMLARSRAPPQAKDSVSPIRHAAAQSRTLPVAT